MILLETSIIYIIGFFVIILFYKHYEKYNANAEHNKKYKHIEQFLISSHPEIYSNKKPIIWIHVDHEVNSRKWLSFGSRNSTNVNQPYLNLTIKSIINKCGDSFNICLIDDYSFGKLIPEWSIRVEDFANPIKSKVRELALAKLLYIYGGMCVPPSFLCIKNLEQMYYKYTQNNKILAGELINNHNINNTGDKFMVSNKIIGCFKGNQIMKDYINYLGTIVSNDFTDESIFLGSSDAWLRNKTNVIDGMLLGVKDINGKPILVDKLMGDEYIDFSPNAYGIYIPKDELLMRQNYKWFVKLPENQVLGVNNNIGKLILTTQ